MMDLLTTDEVRDLLHVDRTTIYRMVEGGRLPAIRVGKQWRFPRAEVEAWLAAQATTPAESSAVIRRGAGSVMPPRTVPIPLAELLPLSCVQLVQDTFADMLGVTMIITDMAGQPVTQVSNPCGLYAAVIQEPEALSCCVLHWQQMAGAASLEPKFTTSDLGLLCARGFIRLGNELRGMVFFGGVAPEAWPPTPAEIANIAAHFDLAPQVIEANIEAVHRLDRADQARVLRFVQRIADVISHMAEDRNAVQGRLQAIASLAAL